jgi:hypothetical protein
MINQKKMENAMKINQGDNGVEKFFIDEIMIILEEKKISLSFIRVGISILAAQVFAISFLIATSKFYTLIEVMHMTIPFYFINVFLFLLALYLIISSLVQIKSYNRALLEYKKRSRHISNLME